MTAGEEGARESLRFRLEGGAETVGTWGHEYVRCAQRELPSCPALSSVSAHVLLQLRPLEQQFQQATSRASISCVYTFMMCTFHNRT